MALVDLCLCWGKGRKEGRAWYGICTFLAKWVGIKKKKRGETRKGYFEEINQCAVKKERKKGRKKF